MGTLVIAYFMVLIFVLVLVIAKKIHWVWLLVTLAPVALVFLLFGLVILLVAKSPPRINQGEVDKVVPKSTHNFGVNPKIVDFTSGFKNLYNFSGPKRRK